MSKRNRVARKARAALLRAAMSGMKEQRRHVWKLMMKSPHQKTANKE